MNEVERQSSRREGRQTRDGTAGGEPPRAKVAVIVGLALVGTASFIGTIALWTDYPPGIGQHLLPLSGACWMLALAYYLARPRLGVVLACGLGYLAIGGALYAGAVAQHTHVIFASAAYFAITAIGFVLLGHAWRVTEPARRATLHWRIVAIVFLLLDLDALRYAIVLLVRWLVGRRA